MPIVSRIFLQKLPEACQASRVELLAEAGEGMAFGGASSATAISRLARSRRRRT